MSRKHLDEEDIEIIEEVSDNKNKKIIVYGEYDSNFHSPLRRKRIRISLMDILIMSFVLLVIGFVGYRSFEAYGINARNDIRTGHLAMIKEGLEKVISDGRALPEAYQEKGISVDSTLIGIQGYAGEAFFSAINRNVLKDPLDNTYYTYYYKPKTQQYEVMAYLEGVNKNSDDIGFWGKTYQWIFQPVDYANRIPYSIGSIGNIVLANTGKYRGTPLNQVVTGSQINLSNKESYEQYLYLGASCQDILAKYPEYKDRDGIRLILLGSQLTRVYCDMTTDGGGWTLFYANNGYDRSPIKESYVQMREKMKKGVYNLSDYFEPGLAGLLNTTHFGINGAREILAKNRIAKGNKWVKFSFSTSESLSWALGKDVLGKTNLGCYALPNNGTWSIVNDDGKIKYDGLKQMMNHGGTSWGVSHEKYLCNGQTKGVSPHIGFYNANNSAFDNRARGNEGVGGKWGDGNEYRYFIR